MSDKTINLIRTEMSKKLLEKFKIEQEEDGFKIGMSDSDLIIKIDFILRTQFPKFPKE